MLILTLNSLRVHGHFIRHFFVFNLSITSLVSVVWEMAMGNRKRLCDKRGKDTATWVVLRLNVTSTFNYTIVARKLSDLICTDLLSLISVYAIALALSSSTTLLQPSISKVQSRICYFQRRLSYVDFRRDFHPKYLTTRTLVSENPHFLKVPAAHIHCHNALLWTY